MVWHNEIFVFPWCLVTSSPSSCCVMTDTWPGSAKRTSRLFYAHIKLSDWETYFLWPWQLPAWKRPHEAKYMKLLKDTHGVGKGQRSSALQAFTVVFSTPWMSFSPGFTFFPEKHFLVIWVQNFVNPSRVSVFFCGEFEHPHHLIATEANRRTRKQFFSIPDFLWQSCAMPALEFKELSSVAQGTFALTVQKGHGGDRCFLPTGSSRLLLKPLGGATSELGQRWGVGVWPGSPHSAG